MKTTILRLCLFLVVLLSGALGTAGAQVYSDIHDFGGTITLADGSTGEDSLTPQGTVTFDSNGNLYGIANEGGQYGYGNVWELTATGVYLDLHDFGLTVTNSNGQPGPDGRYPQGSIAVDSAGNVYGTAEIGGLYSAGMVFEITPSAQYFDLHDFGGTVTLQSGQSGPDGQIPNGGVTLYNGVLYGTTEEGGPNTNGYGMVWSVTTSGVYTDLHDFNSNIVNANGHLGPDGNTPSAAVVIDGAGNMYGTCGGGGPNNAGNLWKITSTGSYIDLHDFGGTVTLANGHSGSDGQTPQGAPNLDSAGNVYGTATNGGPTNHGMLWAYSSTGQYTDLHDFGGTITTSSGMQGPDGWYPYGPVTFDTAGNMYGTASWGAFGSDSGMLWEITKSGTYLDLHDFGGTSVFTNGVVGTDAYQPLGNIVIDGYGNLYGTAADGGAYKDFYGITGGTIWEIGPSLSTLSITPGTVAGGDSATGKVTLSHPTGLGAIAVNLSSTQSFLVPPAAAFVPPGSTSGTFTIATTGVQSTATGEITAYTPTTFQSASLTVLPATVQSVSVVPSSVYGGSTTTGTVIMQGAVAPSGDTITLSSSNTSVATVPATVKVGTSGSANFTITTLAVTSPQSVTITATLGSSHQSTTVQVLVAPTVSLSFPTVFSGITCLGRVTVSFAAPAGGFNVALTSANTGVAQVPASVTIPAGSTSATFSMTSSFVQNLTNVNITATVTNGGNATATSPFSVYAPWVTSVSINPNSVAAGVSTSGTVTLVTAVATGGTITVNLSSSGASATPQATVSVPAGSTTGTFTVNTSSVTGNTTDTITATSPPEAGTRTATTTMTVTPATLSGVSVNPTSVAGGATSTGTVTLSANAPTGGTTVSLSSNSSNATVPATVLVAAGHSTATFTVSTSAVSAATSATITATLGSVQQTAMLSLTTATLQSVSLNPASVIGGNPSTGTVTLAGAAGPAGFTVNLSSNSSNATVPSSVTVAAGASTATFQVTTQNVASTTTATITATAGSQSPSAVLTLTGGTTVSLNFPTVFAGNTCQATVTAGAAAPAGGFTVSLQSANTGVAQVPTSVVIPAGATSVNFPITSSFVPNLTNVNITATLTNGGGSTATKPFSVYAPWITGISVNPSSAVGGTSATGTVTLVTNVASGGSITVNLTSSASAASVPATVVVPAGANTANFTINTSAVTSNVTSTITGTTPPEAGVRTASTTVTVTPLSITGLMVAPTSVAAGISSTGTVTLSNAPGGTGATINLSSNGSDAQVPATIVVPAGSTTGTFTIHTSGVNAPETLTITASFASSQQTAQLSIQGPTVQSVSMSPNTVYGGVTSNGTVTLTNPAPSGGLVVSLGSNSSAATVPSSVMVAAGSTTAPFVATTTAVASNTSATITATSGSTSVMTNLNVLGPVAVSLNFPTVFAGVTLQATVTVGTAAPAGGFNVNLMSANTSVAQVPASVTIPAGATSATFSISTGWVTTLTQVNITATVTNGGGGTTTKALSVYSPFIVSISANPATVSGGSSSTGTVTLAAVVAPGGSVTVTLSSNSSSVTVPATVVVPAGSNTATFPINTITVTSNITATITGTTPPEAGARTASTTITVTP